MRVKGPCICRDTFNTLGLNNVCVLSTAKSNAQNQSLNSMRAPIYLATETAVNF